MAEVSRIETFVFRYPLSELVRTSFGNMSDRPMLIVRVTDSDGAEGYGEVWCNFPGIGAEYRARLIDCELAPRVVGRTFAQASDLGQVLTSETHLLLLQTGEVGPITNCIAGLDAAYHDLCARRAGLPLCAFLGARAGAVPVYASGINPKGAAASAEACLAQGYDWMKFKVGFGRDTDLRNTAEVFAAVGHSARIAIDSNQCWSLESALEMARSLAEFDLLWLEEPIAADRPDAEWSALKAAAVAPLAGGENILSRTGLDRAIRAGALSFVQPDIAKWGGVGGCLEVARTAMAAGRCYCPHFLGGGVGLMASAHLLAAAGGEGRLEVDINPNPLRSELLEGAMEDPAKGMILPDAPGLGITPDLQALKKYQTHHGDHRRDGVVAA